MPDDNLPTFSNLLRQARRDASLTQEDLAERAGLSARTISDLERGLSLAPQSETVRLLTDALNLTPEECRYWQLVRKRLATRRGSDSRQTSTRPQATHGNVNLPIDSFVGRDREIAEVVNLLDQPQVRMVTLTGPGGVGKTRLALAVSQHLADRFPDGVWFVNLAPISDPDLVFPAIVRALGIATSGNEPAASVLTEALRASHRLVVLDNVEQVAAVAPALAMLVAACPGLMLIVTSRMSLRIRGEYEYPISPLALPDSGEVYLPEQVRLYEAIDLFEQRAQSIMFDFEVDDLNADAVVAICQRLDGLPLAIELAAARIRLLPPTSLLNRLDRRLPLLSSFRSDFPERQQTLANTIAWSYDLLTPEQQTLFRTFGVFRGGLPLGAIDYLEEQAGIGLVELEALISSSLVRVQETVTGESRYSMLETITEFARDRLDESGEGALRRQQHADYYLVLLEEAERHFRGPKQEQWMARLERESDNIRAALTWTRSRGEAGDRAEIVRALRMTAAAWWFWYVQGHHREAREQLSPVVRLFRSQLEDDAWLADFPEVVNAYARSVFAHASFAYWTIDIEEIKEMIEESRTIGERFNEQQAVAQSVHLSALLAAYLAGHVGNYADAGDLFEQAIEIFSQEDDTGGVAIALLGQGEMWLRRGEYEAAATSLDKSLRLFTGLADQRAIAATRATLGAVRLHQGRLSEARELLTGSIRTRYDIGDKGGVAWCLERLADLALQDTEPPDIPPMRAARLLSAAKKLRGLIESPVDLVDEPEIERITTAARSQISDEAFVAAWEAGRTMGLEDAVHYAIAARRRPVEPMS